MALTNIFCPSCQQWRPRENGAIAQANKAGLKLYCGRVCAGIRRRKESPVSPRNPNWKTLKAAYDKQRREKHGDRIRAEKRAYYAKVGPLRRDQEREIRKARMPNHIEYCRQPAYRIKKEKYDRKRRATLQFGPEFAEPFLILQQIENEIDSRIDRNEIYRQNGVVNKSVQRRREYERITNQATSYPTRQTKRRSTQGSALVNPQRDQDRRHASSAR